MSNPPIISGFPLKSNGVNYKTPQGEELIVSRNFNPPTKKLDHDFQVNIETRGKSSGLSFAWRPLKMRFGESPVSLTAGVVGSGDLTYDKKGSGSLMADLGLAFDSLHFSPSRVGVQLFPALHIQGGAGFSATPVFGDGRLSVDALELGPLNHMWGIDLGAQFRVDSQNGLTLDGGATLSFVWYGKPEKNQSKIITEIKPANIDISELQHLFAFLFDDIDLTDVDALKIKDMPVAPEFAKYKQKSTEALTLVFFIPDMPNAKGQAVSREELIEHIKRSLLFLFMSGSEKTNPYYHRFDQFRFVLARATPKVARPKTEALKCGDIPGIDKMDDALSEFLFNEGFKNVTIVNVLPDCRSQASPFDMLIPPGIMEDLAPFIEASQNKKSPGDLETLVQAAPKILQKNDLQHPSFWRLKELAQECLTQGSLEPVFNKLITYYWAPRVFLGYTSPDDYPILRHELGHTITARNNGDTQHFFALDGYVEGDGDAFAMVKTSLNKVHLDETQLLDFVGSKESASFIKKPSALFPTLFVGGPKGIPPDETGIRATLRRDDLVQIVLKGLADGTLSWLHQGLYGKDGGIWQLQVKVNASGEPDPKGETKLAYMTDSNSPTAPFDPVSLQIINEILGAHREKFIRKAPIRSRIAGAE